jgi:hypothetical protein
MTQATIDKVYDTHAKHVLDLSQTEFLKMSNDEFTQKKHELVQVLRQMADKEKGRIQDLKVIHVVNDRDIDQQIKEAFENRRFAATVRDTATNLLNQGWDLISPAHRWNTRAAVEQQNFMNDLIQGIEQLFNEDTFRMALARDKANGTIQVALHDTIVGQYIGKGYDWFTDATKEALIWTTKKGVEGVAETVKNIFVQSFSFAWGKITGNQQMVDYSEQYFKTLLAMAAASAGLLAVIGAVLGTELFIAYKVVKTAITWAVKGTTMFFSVMVYGLYKDAILICGSIKIDKMASPPLNPENIKVSVGRKMKLFVQKRLTRFYD